MAILTLGQIREGTGGIILQGRPSHVFSSFSIDTRTSRPGDFFFPIKGGFHDGHEFLREALARGARGIVSQKDLEEMRLFESVIMVKDTTRALQELARYVRERNPMRVIGVTGTTGKTTTKDFIATLLGKTALKSEGNLNNQYGLPLSLLRARGKEAFAVLEMGMSTIGEIRRLCQIAAPSVGVLTNISPVHLQTLGTLQNVARAKAELLDALPLDGLAVINGDDPWVRRVARRFRGRTLSYGFTRENRYRAVKVECMGLRGMRFTLLVGRRRYPASIRMVGRHVLSNLLAAVAVAHGVGVPLEKILARIREIRPASHRGEILRLPGGALLLDDAYNSNPRALEATIETLGSCPGTGRRVLLAGDMLELGKRSREYHLQMGREIGRSRLDALVCVGREAALFAEGAKKEGFRGEIRLFRQAVDAGLFLADFLRPGDTLAVKGSRGLALEKAIAVLREDGSSATNGASMGALKEVRL